MTEDPRRDPDSELDDDAPGSTGDAGFDDPEDDGPDEEDEEG